MGKSAELTQHLSDRLTSPENSYQQAESDKIILTGYHILTASWYQNEHHEFHTSLMILFHKTLGVFQRLRQSLNDFQSKISFFIFPTAKKVEVSHSFFDINLTDKDYLKNIELWTARTITKRIFIYLTAIVCMSKTSRMHWPERSTKKRTLQNALRQSLANLSNLFARGRT